MVPKKNQTHLEQNGRRNNLVLPGIPDNIADSLLTTSLILNQEALKTATELESQTKKFKENSYLFC